MSIYFLGQKGIPAHGGGVERHVEELAIRLAAKGQEVFVYTRKRYTDPERTSYKGVTLISTPAIYTKHLEAISHTFLSLLDLVRRPHVDVLHIHAIGPSLLIPLARVLKPRAKVVATIHCSDYNHQKWGAFARFCLRLGERIAATMSHTSIAVSRGLQSHIKHAYARQLTYIPNGVQLPALGSDPALLKQWNLQPGEYLVAISRLVKHKGVHFLIEAYKALETDKKLVIVGGAEYTDEYVASLKTLAGDNENIIFTGKQTGENLQALFEHAYLFVQPSLSEGLSIALLEALGYKQTVLASDIPENTEVMHSVGFAFRAGDTKDLATKLQFLLEHPEIIKQYKELGREHVAKQYNWEDITEETLDVYEAALKVSALSPLRKVKRDLA